jgi:ribosomal protein S18 acetylase RimI-like enzyme
MIDIVKDVKDIAPLVDMHYNAFKGRLTSELGKKYIACFFSNVITSEHGVFYTYREGNKILGFVCGTTDIDKFWNKNYMVKLGKFALSAIMKNPLLVFGILRHMWVDHQINKLKVNAHMLSFVVLEGYRGRGIGQKLVQAFSNFMEEQGVQNYLIPYTDARDYASKFYQKMGFRLNRVVNFFGHKDNCFIFDLSSSKKEKKKIVEAMQ